MLAIGGRRGKETGRYPSPRYTGEFKAKAVELYQSAGPEATYAGVARSLGCDAGSLSKWVGPASNDQPGDSKMNPFQNQEENRRLRRKLARVKEENKIL